MRWLFRFMFLLLALFAQAVAQNKDPHDLMRWNVFDINKLATKFSNTNLLAAGTNQAAIFPAYPPSMEYPAGSGINYGGAVSFVVGGLRQSDAGGSNAKGWPYFDSGMEEGPAWIWDPHHFESYAELVHGDRTPMSDDKDSWPKDGPNAGWPEIYPNYTFLTMNDLQNLVPTENANLPRIPILLDSATSWPGAGVNGQLIADQESFSIDHTVNYVAEKEPGKQERWLNIQTITRGMAWKLPKYEDMIFWKLIVRNMGQQIDSCLIGIFNNYQFVADFEPFGGFETGGEGADDALYWDADRQLAYGTDFNGHEFDTRGNDLQGYQIAWGGTVVLKTPHNSGVTRFDAFDGLKLFSTPAENGIFERQLYWYNLLNLSDPDDPDGDGIDEGPYINPWDGTAHNYKYGYTYNTMASGPFLMQPGEIDTLIVATVFGQSKEDLLLNVDNAIALYKLNFNVPKPPPQPQVTAIAGDQKVVLRWGRESEKDPLFEGYRIYRSRDDGATWSDNYATDENGTPVAPIPLDQYDLANEFSGVSSRFPLFYLGGNTGLGQIQQTDSLGNIFYEWTDHTAVNNYSYRYWVSAYTHGDSLKEPLETPPANDPSIEHDNTVAVTPASAVATNGLGKIDVVPNPYKVNAEWESDIGVRRIAFTGLPVKCTIRIYNSAGEQVARIKHDNGLSYEYWNVHNMQDQEIAPGLYFYHIDAGALGQKTGKLVIIL